MIKNIIFDVGGVILGYRMKELFMEHIGDNPEEAERLGKLLFYDSAWLDLDRGTRPIVDIFMELKNKYPVEYPTLEWFVSHAQRMPVARPKVWNEMKRLKEAGYGIYVLSNYSEFLLSLHTDGLPFWDCVDGKVISYQIHKIKPETEIYEHLLKKYNLNPEECLFFDDRKINCYGAKKCGIESICVETEESLLAEMKKIS